MSAPSVKSVLEHSNNLPIRTDKPIHSGKVRSVYWLTAADSRRLIKDKGYTINPDAMLAVMVISDRLSAFEALWSAEGGLRGVPGKGAALNAISYHWFKLFREKGLADSHVLDVPHPLVWIVQRARPVLVEAIARQYITGSMWRAYSRGAREFCGISIPDGLEKDTKLPKILITPSTKGIIKGVPGVPEHDDVNVARSDLENNFGSFNFESLDDIDRYEKLLADGFAVISDELAKTDQIFVDTKFEFGYVTDTDGKSKLIYMDEVGTPDSSRIWDGDSYRGGKVLERSKESFRQRLLGHFEDPDILLNKDRMDERVKLAADSPLPLEFLMDVSKIYVELAERITGSKLTVPEDAESEIITILREQFGIID